MNDNLSQQILELQSVHSGLQVQPNQDISGILVFKAAYSGLETIEDSFEIKLMIPENYPSSLPTVFEIAEKIDREYEHINSDRSLCLAVPMEERELFLKKPTLLGFINNLVVPYFYSYIFWKKYGYYPFGEAAHGREGIQQYYQDLFQSKNQSALKLGLYMVAKNGYRGHHSCPCGSGRILFRCHKVLVYYLAQP